MKCLYNMWPLKYFILIYRACFLFYGELVLGQKDILSTSHSFIYTNVLLKLSTN